MKDFAPYITKIMGSGADCIYTADWLPDAGNLLKQSRELGMKLPFVNLFMDEPNGREALILKKLSRCGKAMSMITWVRL